MQNTQDFKENPPKLIHLMMFLDVFILIEIKIIKVKCQAPYIVEDFTNSFNHCWIYSMFESRWTLSWPDLFSLCVLKVHLRWSLSHTSFYLSPHKFFFPSNSGEGSINQISTFLSWMSSYGYFNGKKLWASSLKRIKPA